MSLTPEFLSWALERACPLRGSPDWRHPAATERELRALRGASDAASECRVIDGIALHEKKTCENGLPLGFPLNDVVAAYGGQAAVAAACGNCPANVVPVEYDGRWAGCFGHVELGIEPTPAHRLCEQTIDQIGCRRELQEKFLVTSPAWYGWWASSPLSVAQIALLADLLPELAKRESGQFAGLLQLADAVSASRTSGLPLHVRLTPVGRVEENRWITPIHCPACRASLPSFTRQFCPVCGREGFPEPEKKRHLRGERPYLPLSRFLSEQRIEEVLKKHRIRPSG